MGKLAAYKEVLARGAHRSHLGIPNLLVLVLTTNSARMDHALAKTRSAQGFLFKALESPGLTRPVPELLLEPRMRAGFAPLRIGEPGDTPLFPPLRQ